MLELHKLAKETDNEYIYRICAAKDQIGTWDDVADVINKELGQDKDECIPQELESVQHAGARQ